MNSAQRSAPNIASPRAMRVVMDGISGELHSYSTSNQQIVKQTKMVAINAIIEAARAGDSGKGFAVVANEVQRLAQNGADIAIRFQELLLGRIALSQTMSESLVEEMEGARLSDLAQTLVQLIVRNLYERTADVRWWATDTAFWMALERADAQSVEFAANRLSTINRFYSVYHDLVLTDKSGTVVASANRAHAETVAKADIARQQWFKDARATKTGDDYVVGHVEESAAHGGREVLVYATAVRAGGQTDGEIMGTLGVYFDWQEQGRAIVEKEAVLPPQVKERTVVLLLDQNKRVIATTDPVLRFRPFELRDDGRDRGSYYDGAGNIVAFAKTLGYQEYDGLGWWGVVIQKTEQEDQIRRELGLQA